MALKTAVQTTASTVRPAVGNMPVALAGEDRHARDWWPGWAEPRLWHAGDEGVPLVNSTAQAPAAMARQASAQRRQAAAHCWQWSI